MALVPTSKGALTVMSYALQTDPDKIPTTGWKNLPYRSTSLTPKYESVDSETITASRIESAGATISASADGDIEVEFAKDVYDDFLSAVAFNNWAGNVLTFGGKTEKMFAIERNNSDIGIAHYFKAAMVNSFRLNIAPKQLVTATFGMMARGYENKTDGTTFSVNPTPVAEFDTASSLSIEDIKIDGVTVKGVACAKAFDLEVNNNAQIVECLGSGIFASGIAEMRQTVSGNLTLAYTKMSQGFVDNQVNGGKFSIEVTIRFDDGSKYVFALPMVQVKGGEIPSGGVNDILDQQISYKAVDQAITITKVAAHGTP